MQTQLTAHTARLSYSVGLVPIQAEAVFVCTIAGTALQRPGSSRLALQRVGRLVLCSCSCSRVVRRCGWGWKYIGAVEQCGPQWTTLFSIYCELYRMTRADDGRFVSRHDVLERHDFRALISTTKRSLLYPRA